jgi:hypothetical protein
MEVRTTVVLSNDEYLSLKKRSSDLNMSVSRFLRYLYATYGERPLNKSRGRSMKRISGSITNRDLRKILKTCPDYSYIETFSPIGVKVKFKELKDGVYTTHLGDVYRHSISGGGYCYTRKRYFNPETNDEVIHHYKKKYPHELFFYGQKGKAFAAVLYGESFDYSLESFKKIMEK